MNTDEGSMHGAPFPSFRHWTIRLATESLLKRRVACVHAVQRRRTRSAAGGQDTGLMLTRTCKSCGVSRKVPKHWRASTIALQR